MSYSYAQRGISVDQGAYSSAIGGISTVIKGTDGIFGNFSNIVDEKKSSFLVSTSRRFSLSELSSYSLGAHVPFDKIGHLALAISSYGFDSYKEQEISLQYARKLGQNISVSTKLGYQSVAIEDNGSKSSFLFNLGLAGSISEGLQYGLLISNPESRNITDSTPLISELKFGLSYDISKKVIAYTELEKSLEEDLNFKIGLNYSIHPQFSLRTGFNTNPGNTSFGFNYQIISKLSLYAAFVYDSLLGISPVITLKWQNSQKPL